MTRRVTGDYRDSISLNGPWQFVTDPDDDGREEGWDGPGDWPDHARTRARTVDVPHAWQELEEYRDYTGTAWYRRTVSVEPAERERVRLRFGAVDYETTVWVNGEEIGSNRGGYLPFELDATDAITSGENEIVLEVVDPEDVSEIPHGKQGEPWYHRISGIWQDVSLEIVPERRVSGIEVTPNLEDDTARVDVDVAGVDSETGQTATIDIEVTREDETVARTDATVDADGSATATLAIDEAEYWSPENPVLYDVGVELEVEGSVVDRDEDYFGMRSIETRDGRLFLNGEPYYMRGALDQGLYPKTLYRPFSDDLFEREVRIAKELGFNLLRKHIKPAHPDFLEQADRQGLLVWEEPANPTVHTERSKREVRDQLEGMIRRDYNRPSVIVWSLYNEEWGIGNPQGLDEETSLWEDEKKQEYLADLYEETKARDPTRIVCDNSGWAHVATDLNDYHRYFVSPDRAEAWADDLEEITSSPADNYGATMTDPEDAPLIVSEFGTWGMCDTPAIEEFYGDRPPWFDHEFLAEGLKRPAGYRDRFADSTLSEVFEDWSALAEEWQWREYRSIKDVIEQMRVHEGVAGYVITEFSDIEWEFNGILDYRREEKAFHDDFARINSDVLVRIDCETHTLRPGETLEADLVVVNDTTDAIDDELEWHAFGRSGTVPVALEGFGTERLEGAISLEVPADAVEGVTTDELAVSLADLASNEEPVTVVPDVASGDGGGDVAVYAATEPIAAALSSAGAGFDVVDSLEAADVAILTDPDDEARAYVEDGGTALVVPTESGAMADEQFFDYRDLPEKESWNLVACLFYRDSDVLAEYVDTVPGWELEGCYPYDVVADVDRERDEVHVGYVEGWLANWSAAVCAREFGEGTVAACTFRLTGDTDNPVGDAILAALVDDLGAT
ncbi:glycoside hydrolase family 2 protein [Natronoglomus mannanivorans]|uniref:Beta-galactosidase n=1 Tax=Natronoglomus mannanivorans TaxID=2979990 RepID=A0AAP3E312_9EURY|nr:beta-galactosidase [Halobacteria archaeon AArc-xg1-1]